MANDTSTIFRERFQYLIDSRGLGIDDIANGIKTDRSNISHWKNGRYLPRKSTIEALANWFKVNPLWLIGLSDDSMENINNIITVNLFSLSDMINPIGLFPATNRNTVFAVELPDDSLSGAGIKTGMIATIERAAQYEHGDIVLVEHPVIGLVLRRLSISETGAILVPENSEFQAVTINKHQLSHAFGRIGSVTFRVGR